MLSRRQFLQAAGITLAAAPLTQLEFPVAAPNFEPLYGRALATAPIYAAPDLAAPITVAALERQHRADPRHQ